VGDHFGGRDAAVYSEQAACRLADGGDVFFEPSDVCAWSLGSAGG